MKTPSYHIIDQDKQLFRTGIHQYVEPANANLKAIREATLFDEPGLKFFKIFFHFYNGDCDKAVLDGTNHHGLLAPSWEISIQKTAAGSQQSQAVSISDMLNSKQDLRGLNYDKKVVYDILKKCDSAWAYLMLNGEFERADYLKDFIQLLQRTNAETPWYFQSITGINDATKRDFKIGEERKKITINCLTDSVDNRIQTMLDLYRAAAFSWLNKREVLPANLRKFDMSILIFESPIMNLHALAKDPTNIMVPILRNFSKIKDEDEQWSSSYKYLEFHNCEFDYNTASAPYSTISNAEGTQIVHNIDIFFDDCIEATYNEFINELEEFGDAVYSDLHSLYGKPAPAKFSIGHSDQKLDILKNDLSIYAGFLPDNIAEEQEEREEQDKKYNLTKNKKNFVNYGHSFSLSNALKTAGEQLVMTGIPGVDMKGFTGNDLLRKVKRIALGNIYTGSLFSLINNGSKLLSGDISGSIQMLKGTKGALKDLSRKGTQLEKDLKEKYPNNPGKVFWGKTVDVLKKGQRGYLDDASHLIPLAEDKDYVLIKDGSTGQDKKTLGTTTDNQYSKDNVNSSSNTPEAYTQWWNNSNVGLHERLINSPEYDAHLESLKETNKGKLTKSPADSNNHTGDVKLPDDKNSSILNDNDKKLTQESIRYQFRNVKDADPHVKYGSNMDLFPEKFKQAAIDDEGKQYYRNINSDRFDLGDHKHRNMKMDSYEPDEVYEERTLWEKPQVAEGLIGMFSMGDLFDEPNYYARYAEEIDLGSLVPDEENDNQRLIGLGKMFIDPDLEEKLSSQKHQGGNITEINNAKVIQPHVKKMGNIATTMALVDNI